MLTQWPLASQPPHVGVQDEERAGKNRRGHTMTDGRKQREEEEAEAEPPG